MSPSLTVSLMLIALIIAGLSLHFYLGWRQMRHVLQHRHRVPPGFETEISPEEHDKAARYTAERVRLGLVAVTWSAATTIAWTLLGGLQLLQTAFLSLGLWPAGQWGMGVAVFLAFMGIAALLEWPLSLYSAFVLEKRFGFNRMTLGTWFADQLKGALLAGVIGIPLLVGVMAIASAAGDWWWLWAWLLWIAFSALMMFIWPMWIAPWFNRFEALQDESLLSEVQALFDRCGHPARGGIFVMDGSRRSAHSNAYFTGFGASQRVVFYDTLLKGLDRPALIAVLAHELGHQKLRHIPKGMLASFLMSGLLMAAMGYLSQQVPFYDGLGVSVLGGTPPVILALLLMILVYPWVGLWLSPMWSAWSRKHEYQADAYAAQHASGQALAQALVTLNKDNASTLTPDPLWVWFHHSHPPTIDRLRALQP